MSTYLSNSINPKKGTNIPGNYVSNWLGVSLKKFGQALQPYIDTNDHIEVSYEELQSLKAAKELNPGAVYKIKGFNKNQYDSPFLPFNLYDDGTDSGITIYMKAVSPDLMESTGYGEFYNPKYTGQAEYNNTDGTGLYQIWDGDNPDPLQVPAYGVGDVVYWGGYAWKNVTGNVGNLVDLITLSADWVKLPYTNTTYYNLVIDEIGVDWSINMVVARKNIASNIEVTWTAAYYSNVPYFTGIPLNPIATIPWGINTETISNLYVNDSYVDFINFKGVFLLANTFSTGIFTSENYYGKDLTFYENIFIQSTTFFRNFFTTYNTFTYNHFSDSTFESNNFDSVNYDSNQSIGSESSFNDVKSSQIANNILTNSSELNDNIVDTNSFIINNNLKTSSKINNCLIYSSQIANNELFNNASLEIKLYSNSFVRNNLFQNSTVTPSNNFSGKDLKNNTFKNVTITANLNTATHIYGNYTKDVFTRQDGTVRLAYYNNSDVLTVVAVTA